MTLKNKPSDVLFIMTDQHTFQLVGCAGHSVIKTPKTAHNKFAIDSSQI
jgi:hypothetical protein